jgi:hypothetical protein
MATTWAHFNPETDHFVRGFADRLPAEGEIQELVLEGESRRERVVAAWWDEGSFPDPLFAGKRALSLITRPVE